MPDEPFVIQDLVQKRVIEKLNQPDDYIHRTTVPPRENHYAYKTFTLSIQITFSSPSSENREMEKYKQRRTYMLTLLKMRN